MSFFGGGAPFACFLGGAKKIVSDHECNVFGGHVVEVFIFLIM